MALSIKFLKSLGIDDDKIEAIAEAHGATVNGLKDEIAKFKAEAEKLPGIQKELEDLKASTANATNWEEKFNSEHKALEDLKEKVATDKLNSEKTKLYRDMLTEIGVNSKQLDAIMRVTDLAKLNIKEGKLENLEELQEAAKKDWDGFILKTKKVGSDPATPPKPTNGIEGADPEIAKRIQERHNRLYGTKINPEGE